MRNAYLLILLLASLKPALAADTVVRRNAINLDLTSAKVSCESSNDTDFQLSVRVSQNLTLYSDRTQRDEIACVQEKSRIKTAIAANPKIPGIREVHEITNLRCNRLGDCFKETKIQTEWVSMEIAGVSLLGQIFTPELPRAPVPPRVPRCHRGSPMMPNDCP